MNLRVAHHGEDQEMDVVEDGPIGKSNPTVQPPKPYEHPNIVDLVRKRIAVTDMAASLLRAVQRDPNPQGRWKKAVLSTDGTELLIDTADGRTFIATIREVS